jgi:Type I phosphodiesterase / nucleotide pyrophosphatase
MALLVVAATCADDPPAQDPEDESGRPSDRRSERAGSDDAPGWFGAACDLPRQYLRAIRRGHVPGRSPDLAIVPAEPNFFGNFLNTTHSGPWDYLQEVPVLLYGPGFIQDRGEITPSREITVADIAPTIAELIGADLPEERPGRPINEALIAGQGDDRPKLVLTVVWDGGGWNVLRQWPEAWPSLSRLATNGTTITNSTVGSSPSVTPAIHTTIGTGAFPREHGIVSIEMRDGDAMVGSFGASTPNYLDVPTLADLYDQQTANEALIGLFAERNWMLGMIGHGAYLAGGDRDIAVMIDEDSGVDLHSNESWYTLPPYVNSIPGLEDFLRQVDLDDGKLDDRWRGRDFSDPTTYPRSPAWILYQTEIIKQILSREGFGQDDIPDLMYVNYKQIDHFGHLYNMLNKEVEGAIRYADAAVGDLASFLDRSVGEGEWVIIFTADHGQTPLAESIDAWPIDMEFLQKSTAEHFGVKPQELFDGERPNGFWLDPQTLNELGVTRVEVARFLLDYRVADNVRPGDELPPAYRGRAGERLFAAAFPARSLDEVWRCAVSRD